MSFLSQRSQRSGTRMSLRSSSCGWRSGAPMKPSCSGLSGVAHRRSYVSISTSRVRLMNSAISSVAAPRIGWSRCSSIRSTRRSLRRLYPLSTPVPGGRRISSIRCSTSRLMSTILPPRYPLSISGSGFSPRSKLWHRGGAQTTGRSPWATPRRHSPPSLKRAAAPQCRAGVPQEWSKPPRLD